MFHNGCNIAFSIILSATTSTGHALSTSSTVSQSTINGEDEHSSSQLPSLILIIMSTILLFLLFFSAATSTGHAPSTSSTVSQSTINGEDEHSVHFQ